MGMNLVTPHSLLKSWGLLVVRDVLLGLLGVQSIDQLLLIGT
jgi:hypothetical protein